MKSSFAKIRSFCDYLMKKTQSLESQSAAVHRGWHISNSFGLLTGLLGTLFLSQGTCSAMPSGPVPSLAWDASPNENVVGYKIYYWMASRAYTNILSVGNVTSAAIHGLAAGATYHFAATAVGANGEESSLSAEVVYTVPVVGQLQINPSSGGGFHLAGAGLTGHTYEILASTNLLNWSIISTQSPGSSGLFGYSDCVSPNCPVRYFRTLDATTNFVPVVPFSAEAKAPDQP